MAQTDLSKIGLSDLSTVTKSIRNFRATGRFAEADRFIGVLPHNIRTLKKIAIEIAQLYLVQGQYHLAAQTCDDSFQSALEYVNDDSVDVPSIRIPEVAAFELVRAFIWIGRYSKLKTALRIAQHVGKIWQFEDSQFYDPCELEKLIRPELGSLPDTFNTSHKPKGTALLDIENREYEVLIIHYYWKILVVAADQGLLDVKSTRARAVNHIRPLRRAVQSEGLLYEARLLIYLETNIMRDRDEALQELQAFAELLTPQSWPVERAYTLVDIVEIQIMSSSDHPKRAEEAQVLIREARELFDTASHTFGNTDLDLILTSLSHDISAYERFTQKLKLADRYYAVGHLQNGSRCLMHAISPDMVADDRFKELNSTVQLLDEKICLGGGEMLKQVSLLHAVTQAALKAPEFGFALQCLENYLQHLPPEIGPTNHCGIVMTLAQVYKKFGRDTEALQLAERALDIAESGMSYSDKSDAAFLIGVHQYAMARKHEASSAEEARLADSARDILSRWVDTDARNGFKDNVSLKCLHIADSENYRLRHNPNADPAAEEAILEWIERAKTNIPDSASVEKWFEITQLELRVLTRQQKFKQGVNVVHDLLSKAISTPGIRLVTKAGIYLSASIQTNLLAWATIRGNIDSGSSESNEHSIKLLFTSIKLSCTAFDLYLKTEGVELTIDCMAHVGYQILQYIGLFRGADHSGLLVAVLEALGKTEQVIDRMRHSVIPIKGMESLMSKRQLVSHESCLKLYNIGVVVSLRIGDTGKAWDWLQKGKSRAFADALGATILLPPSLLDRISKDEDARKLLEEEQMLLEMLGEASSNQVLAARRLATLRDRMIDNDLLREVIRIKHGFHDIDIGSDLKEALSDTGLDPKRVKFVDWFVPSRLAEHGNDRLILFVRRLDGTTSMKETDVSVSEVEQWLNDAFIYPEMSEPPLSRKTGNRLLKKMNGLIDGLAELTSDEDLLVLSPPGILKNIPLHALFVGKSPLIERNLIVYASTVSIFRQIILRTQSSKALSDVEPNGLASSTSFFAVYEEPDQEEEREAIFNHVRQLSTTFPGRVFLGPQGTKSRFLEQASSARWMHYHGHARIAKDIVKSSLCLADGTDIFAAGHQDEPSGEGREFSGIDELDVAGLFASNLPAGAHLTVIACDSGRQDVAPGDEPLGIVPALLYAGATSVLGCTWPIDSSTGRVFSEAFYRELGTSAEEGGEGGSKKRVIHLAQALRVTIKSMRKGELGPALKQPYHWAAFTLHGSWFLKLDWEHRENQ
ncbi:CHAT domain-containing protein [Nemania sp. FL0031]|nr:CHAT domain-containing protein [Nemania sp. FL0031]